MNKFRLSIFLLLTLLLCVFFVPTVGAQDCNPDTDLKIHGQSQLQPPSFNSAVVVNISQSCSYDVGLAIYQKFDEEINNQVLFSSQTANIGPNTTLYLGPLALPDCAAQIDLFYGPLIPSFANGERYGSRLLDWEHVGGTNYCVPPPPPPPGNEGCTPGYWKNHTEAWGPSGYNPNQTASSVFANIPGDLGSKTLLQSLDGGGGPSVTGAAKILLRAAVAALLNAAHPDVDYPRTAASIIADVNAALGSNNRDTILALATALDNDNNRGCPIN